MSYRYKYPNQVSGFSSPLAIHVLDIGLIKKLPLEILSHIFLLTQCSRSCPSRCGKQNPACVRSTVLASVCSFWRIAVLNSPSLWAHVHLALSDSITLSNRQANYVKLYAGRSVHSNIALIISVSRTQKFKHDCYDSDSDSEDDMIPEYGYGVSFSDTINSIASRISRLEIHSEAFYGYGLQPLLARLLQLCSNKTLRDLVVHAKTDGYGDNQLLPWKPHYLVQPPNKAHTDELLITLHTLHLSSAMIPWDSSAYHGLTELSLSWADSIPLKLLEFREILSKCPELRILRLKVGYFNYSTTPGTIEPIELKKLHSLILTGIASSDITQLLDFLRPGGPELAIRTDIPAANRYITRIHRFFESATTINELHIRPQSKVLWFNAISHGLNTLLKLTLNSCRMGDLALREYTQAQPEEIDDRLGPMLHTLCLTACWVDFPLLRALVRRTRVKYLIFSHCMTEHGGAISLKMIKQHFGDLEVQTMMENSRKKVDNWLTHWIW